MKNLFLLSASFVLLGSFTGCCYQGGYCDPVTGTYNSGYWAPQCGGPLDPMGVSCHGFPQWNQYGQCVDSNQQSGCPDCGCNSTCSTGCATGCSDCCASGGCAGTNQGYDLHPIIDSQPKNMQPLNPQPVPEYPSGVNPNEPTPVPDPNLPAENKAGKPTAYYAPQTQSFTNASPPVKNETTRRIREAKKSRWIPATY